MTQGLGKSVQWLLGCNLLGAVRVLVGFHALLLNNIARRDFDVDGPIFGSDSVWLRFYIYSSLISTRLEHFPLRTRPC